MIDNPWDSSLPRIAFPQGEMPPVPGELTRLLPDAHFRQEIADADVVLGVDVRDSEYVCVFFGREALEQIVAAGQSQALCVARVPVDFCTNDVEVLCAACVALKGAHCFVSLNESK